MLPISTVLLLLSGVLSPVPLKHRVLILSGQNNHDWEWTTPSLRRMLEASERFEVDVTFAPGEALLDAEALSSYSAFVLDYNGERWGTQAEENFLRAVSQGTGVAVIHAANNAFPGWEDYERLVGHCWREGTSHGRFHAFDIEFDDHEHPITRELPDLIAHPDELYHRLAHMHDASFELLATAYSAPDTGGTGEREPMVTTLRYGKGRVFHTPLGHVWPKNEKSRVSHKDPQFQRLVCRGVEWAATGDVAPYEEHVNRLSEEQRAAGWELLFDGSDTSAWRGFRREGFPESGWTVEDGCLKVSGGGGDLMTRRAFGDFEFAFDWKIAKGANSGVMYRVGEDSSASYLTGPEYQIYDDDEHLEGKNTLQSTAALYALYLPEEANPFPPGQFNRGRIVVHEGRVEHWLNGRLVVEGVWGSADWAKRIAASKFAAHPEFASLAQGHFVLQDHGDEVWFRNLKVRALD